jgi:hypothetical protein
MSMHPGACISPLQLFRELIARIAILNLRTTAETIEEVVGTIRTFVSQLATRQLESKASLA